MTSSLNMFIDKLACYHSTYRHWGCQHKQYMQAQVSNSRAFTQDLGIPRDGAVSPWAAHRGP